MKTTMKTQPLAIQVKGNKFCGQEWKRNHISWTLLF